MRVALYARYSSDLQDVRSIDDQLAEARKYLARQKGWIEVAVFREEAISGQMPLHARPVLLDLMARADAREFDVVLTEHLDRLARRPSVMNALSEELQHAGVRLWTLADGETSDLQVAIKGYMAADYLKNLAQKVRRGHMGRVREGRAPAGRPPYGYERVKGEPCRLVIVEHEAAIVRRIVEHFLAGVSILATAKTLNVEGIPGPGGGHWLRSAITGARTRASGILSNPIYKGATVYGRRSQPKSPRTGRVESRNNGRDTWTVGHDAKLAIIDPEKWDAVQEERERRRRAPPHQRRQRHLLSGLLFCGVCGRKLTVRRHTARGVPYFACMEADSGAGCANRRMVQGTELESRVLASLRDKLLSPEAVELAVRTYREERARLAAERARMRDSTDRELADVRRQLRNVRGAIRELGHSRSLLQDLAELETREWALEAKLPAAEPDVVTLHPQAGPRYAQIVEDLGKALTGPEPARARAFTLLRSLITRVVVTPTPARTPVGLEVHGDLLALFVEDRERQDTARQAGSIAIRA